MTPLQLLLVDDQELVRTGFRMILESQPDMQVIGEAEDGEQAVQLVAQTSPDVVLMDLRMPRTDGIEATRRITARGSDLPRVLILTTFDLDEYVYAGLQAGASGFLLKDVPSAELLTAVRSVAAGDAVVGPTVTRRLIEHYVERPPLSDDRDHRAKALEQFTPRELDVLLELAEGRSNANIGERLHLSEATVKSHVGRILTKLGLRNRVQAVVYAYKHGIVSPADDRPPGP